MSNSNSDAHITSQINCSSTTNENIVLGADRSEVCDTQNQLLSEHGHTTIVNRSLSNEEFTENILKRPWSDLNNSETSSTTVQNNKAGNENVHVGVENVTEKMAIDEKLEKRDVPRTSMMMSIESNSPRQIGATDLASQRENRHEGSSQSQILPISKDDSTRDGSHENLISTSSASSHGSDEISYKFLDEGYMKTVNCGNGVFRHRRVFNSIRLTTSTSSFVVRKGDAVFLFNNTNAHGSTSTALDDAATSGEVDTSSSNLENNLKKDAKTDLSTNALADNTTFDDLWICRVDDFFLSAIARKDRSTTQGETSDKIYYSETASSTADNNNENQSKDATDDRSSNNRNKNELSEYVFVPKMIGTWFFSPRETMRLVSKLDKIYDQQSKQQYQHKERYVGSSGGKTSLEQTFNNKPLKEICQDLKSNEFVLSNFQEEHDVATIMGLCTFQNSTTKSLNNNTFDEVDNSNQLLTKEPEIEQEGDRRTSKQQSNLICRYKLMFDYQKQIVLWSNYDPFPQKRKNQTISGSTTDPLKNTSGDVMLSHNITSKTDEEEDDDERYAINQYNNNSENVDEETSSVVAIQSSSKSCIQEGEGSFLRGDIAIGPKHQVQIKPFDPANKFKTIVSRNPKLVWTPNNSLTDEQLHQFLVNLAKIHNKFLRTNGLIALDEPYSPLPWTQAEQIVRENFSHKQRRRDITTNSMDIDLNNDHSDDDDDDDDVPLYLTGSQMSSASMLASSSTITDSENGGANSLLSRNRLLRECDVDKVLELLADHQFNPETALKAVKDNLQSITTAFSKTERNLFDAGFRINQSSALRDIWKAIGSKSMKDVVDYHYRFKIPDQFRKFQNKKREKAVQILECIERRKAAASAAVLMQGSSFASTSATIDHSYINQGGDEKISTNLHDVSSTTSLTPTKATTALSTTTVTATTISHVNTESSQTDNNPDNGVVLQPNDPNDSISRNTSERLQEIDSSSTSKTKTTKTYNINTNTVLPLLHNQHGTSASASVDVPWSEKTITSVTKAKEERFRIAKKLLLDVKDRLGKESLKEVARLIRQLQTSYDSKTHDTLFQLLRGQHELQDRFLEFLPGQFQ